MSALVLDASVALSWCFENEANASTVELLERLNGETAAVPGIWHLEVANSLVLAERRRRITIADTAAFVALLHTLDLWVDDETPTRAFVQVIDLARSERLTAYDAVYLELAMRLGAPLATKDRELGEAAGRLGVEVLWAG